MPAPLSPRHPRRVLSAIAALALLGTACSDTTAVGRTPRSRLQPGDRAAVVTPTPTSVTVAGSLQSEIGCSGDWVVDCATSHLAYDANDDVWQGSWTLPSGSYDRCEKYPGDRTRRRSGSATTSAPVESGPHSHF